jgi:hypothetical protein
MSGGGLLSLADAQAYTGKISGFSSLGSTGVDLTNFGFGPQVQTLFSGNSRGGVLTIVDGSQTAKLNLVGDYLATVFKAVSDGTGGTKIVGGGLLPTASATPLVTAMASFGAPSASQGSPTAIGGGAHPMLVAPHTAFA